MLSKLPKCNQILAKHLLFICLGSLPVNQYIGLKDFFFLALSSHFFWLLVPTRLPYIWKPEVLTTGPPGKSQGILVLKKPQYF